jgi:hypothetical protein
MSAEALKSLLAKELNTVAGDDTRLISFLYATTTVHQRNSLAVTKSDSDLAITLLQCYSSSGSMTVRQKLEMLVSLWIVGISPDSFAYSRVPALIRIYAKELSSWAQSLKDSCKWLEVREETEWMSLFQTGKSGLNGSSAIQSLLNTLCRFQVYLLRLQRKPSST